jgi:sulfofructose kinase
VKLPLNLDARPKQSDVLCAGENSVDLIAVTDDHPQANAKVPMLDYQELPGGEAASAAVGLARLGWRARYVGRFGDDRLGTFVRTRLIAETVEISDSIVTEQEANRLAVILVNRRSGDRTVLWRRSPRLALRPDDITDHAIASARVLLVGSEDVEAMTDAARRARAEGLRVVGDLEHVHPETSRLLQQLDVVVMATEFPTAFTGHGDIGAALAEIAALSGAALVCVTLGEEGSLALVNGTELRVPAFAVDVVDTTGAGDLFRAGLIARWLAVPVEPDVEDLLRYASAVAALNCRGVGAQSAAPSATEVQALLAR